MRDKAEDGAVRAFAVTERAEIPALSIVLGYGPMLPLVTGAACAWLLPHDWRSEAVILTTTYAAAILAFLAGVRRGLSFRTEGGPRLAQIATMFALFTLALAALLAVMHGLFVAAVACLLLGYIGVMLLDPGAAHRGEAPLFFARLRPPQMLIAVASLAVLLAEVALG